MATLLEICNDVLSDIGENPVTYDTHPVARKVFAAYRTALSHVSSLYKWPHLIAERQATFPTDVGVFAAPGIQCIIDATYVESADVRYRLAHTGRRDLWATNQVVTQSSTDRPCTWSLVGDSQVRVYPTPQGMQANSLFFLVLLKPTLPTNMLSSLQVTLPDDFLQAVKYYTEFLMHMRHTADLASANAVQSVFEQYVHMLRSRKSGEPVSDIWGSL